MDDGTHYTICMKQGLRFGGFITWRYDMDIPPELLELRIGERYLVLAICGLLFQPIQTCSIEQDEEVNGIFPSHRDLRAFHA